MNDYWLYAYKLDNLEQADKFSETHTLPTETGETEHLNSPITSRKTESVMPTLPIKKTNKNKKTRTKSKNPTSNPLTGEFYQAFKEQLMPVILKSIQKRTKQRERTHFD